MVFEMPLQFSPVFYYGKVLAVCLQYIKSIRIIYNISFTVKEINKICSKYQKVLHSKTAVFRDSVKFTEHPDHVKPPDDWIRNFEGGLTWSWCFVNVIWMTSCFLHYANLIDLVNYYFWIYFRRPCSITVLESCYVDASYWRYGGSKFSDICTIFPRTFYLQYTKVETVNR